MAQIHALTPEGRLPTPAVAHVQEIAPTPYESGLRDITSLVATRTAGNLYAQRYGRLVFLMAYGLVCSDQASGFIPVTLPDGLRPPRTLIDTAPLHITGNTTGQRTLISAAGPVTFYGVTAGTGIYLSTTFLTPNSTPATPPGSAA